MTHQTFLLKNFLSELKWYLLFVIMILGIIALSNFADAQLMEIVWIGGDKGIRQVPIFYVDNLDECKSEKNPWTVRGCYISDIDTILIETNYIDRFVSTGCTVRQHEIYHAWGLEHGRDMPPNCKNPNEDLTKGQYDPNNIKHRDPLYVPEVTTYIPIERVGRVSTNSNEAIYEGCFEAECVR